jgi:hypothetical protein
MKKNSWLLLSAFVCILLGILTIQGCIKGTIKGPKTYTYTKYTPVYQLKKSVMAAVNGSPVEPIDSLGKIYIKDNLIFLNDVDKGIHVIDNSNPAHPVQIAFLNIPGNEDIAIKGNILYADMYSDLLAIDISNLQQVQIKNMLPALFADREYVNGFGMDSDQVIISWIKKDTTVPVPSNVNPIYYGGGPTMNLVPSAFSSSSSGGNGVAGSTAKMVLINNYLYAITERHELGAIDVSDATSPVLISNNFAGYDLETIFPFKDKLFLGSDIGTFIYDISNPGNPTKVGEFTHGQACDPVITDGTDAYITLHAGTSCGGASNELDVVNVQNISDALLVKIYPMISPKGLSKDGNLLFVCDGPDVVKLFDATDPAQLQLLAQIKTSGPYDVIAANKNLMVLATQGLFQYDYSNPRDIRLLSFFAVK